MLITIFALIVLVFSVVLHEIAHGFCAFCLGDPTAKYAGRLSLNPLKHLDFLGSFFLPLFTLLVTGGQGPIFGFAKPVPINPYNFRDQRWGELKVAIAGPAANFFVATIFGLSMRFFSLPHFLFVAFSIITFYNFLWGVFNLLPVPPLDGSHILLSLLGKKGFEMKWIFQQYGFLIFLLIIFVGLRIVTPLALMLFKLVVGQPFLF